MELRAAPLPRIGRVLSSMSRRKNTHFTDLCGVLVSAAAHANENRIIPLPLATLRRNPTHRMRAFQGGNDAFETTQDFESFQCLTIGDGHVGRAARILEMCVLRS